MQNLMLQSYCVDSLHSERRLPRAWYQSVHYHTVELHPYSSLHPWPLDRIYAYSNYSLWICAIQVTSSLLPERCRPWFKSSNHIIMFCRQYMHGHARGGSRNFIMGGLWSHPGIWPLVAGKARHKLGGSEGMLPQENFEFSCPSRSIQISLTMPMTARVPWPCVIMQ